MKRRPTVVPAARYTVDAAAKALELLSVFSFREPRLSLADLATRTGIPRATAFRLLSTLEQSGFLAPRRAIAACNPRRRPRGRQPG